MKESFSEDHPDFTNVLSEPRPGWNGLCNKAEPRLVQALRDRTLVVVNNLMAVKALGETVGVALRQQELEGGITQLDTWYEPFEREHIQAIREAFYAGEHEISLTGITRWMDIRPVKVDRVCPGQDLTKKVRGIVGELTTQPQELHGLDRKTYRYRGDQD